MCQGAQEKNTFTEFHHTRLVAVWLTVWITAWLTVAKHWICLTSVYVSVHVSPRSELHSAFHLPVLTAIRTSCSHLSGPALCMADSSPVCQSSVHFLPFDGTDPFNRAPLFTACFTLYALKCVYLLSDVAFIVKGDPCSCIKYTE